MELKFTKMQATGNDFIFINGLKDNICLNAKQIEKLCQRNFGIGADGLIILKPDKNFDFYMDYYNSDGKTSSFCGNGGRASVLAYLYFTNHNLTISKTVNFLAQDTSHLAQYSAEDNLISLSMKNIATIEPWNYNDSDKNWHGFILDTGSPHLTIEIDTQNNIDFFELGKKIRNVQQFQPNGINVNFYTITKTTVYNITYERGVENLTLSCGTGNVAVAATLAHLCQKSQANFIKKIRSKGGQVEVKLDYTLPEFCHDIYLKGEAQLVFSGTINL